MKRVYAILIIAAALMLSACRNDTPLTPTENPFQTTQPDTPIIREEYRFTRENFPRMDGSTSTVPLAQAAACVLLGEPRENVAELTEFNRTTQSFRNLAQGWCDILIVAEPSQDVFEELWLWGFEYEIAPIATEALVFVVNASNPVDSLTIEQIQGIYNGRIKNWREVGGEDIEIVPYQRDPEAGSQVAMEKLVMIGNRMTDPPTQGVPRAFSMGDLIAAMKGFDGSANAIGYTMY